MKNKNNVNLLFAILILFIIGCVCSKQNNDTSSTDSKTKVENLDSIKPVFDVNDLIGKNPKQADKVLGKPVDAFNMRSDASRLLREYNYGESLTLQFYKNRLERLVFFYGSEQKNPEIAFRWCGLKLNGLKPDANPKVGADESQIYNNFLIKNKPVKVVFNENFISFDF